MKLLARYSFTFSSVLVLVLWLTLSSSAVAQIQIFNANSSNAASVATNASLVGTWKISNIICENNVKPNSDIQKLLLNAISFSEFSLFANGNYVFSAKQSEDCSLVSSGTYSAKDSVLSIQINQTLSQCGTSAKSGNQNVPYEIHGDELWLYQPAGYLKGQLCGVETRAIQILKKKQ